MNLRKSKGECMGMVREKEGKWGKDIKVVSK